MKVLSPVVQRKKETVKWHRSHLVHTEIASKIFSDLNEFRN